MLLIIIRNYFLFCVHNEHLKIALMITFLKRAGGLSGFFFPVTQAKQETEEAMYYREKTQNILQLCLIFLARFCNIC